MCEQYLPLLSTKSFVEPFIKEKYFLPHWTDGLEGAGWRRNTEFMTTYR